MQSHHHRFASSHPLKADLTDITDSVKDTYRTPSRDHESLHHGHLTHGTQYLVSLVSNGTHEYSGGQAMVVVDADLRITWGMTDRRSHGP
jgi:hypothetical protein